MRWIQRGECLYSCMIPILYLFINTKETGCATITSTHSPPSDRRNQSPLRSPTPHPHHLFLPPPRHNNGHPQNQPLRATHLHRPSLRRHKSNQLHPARNPHLGPSPQRSPRCHPQRLRCPYTITYRRGSIQRGGRHPECRAHSRRGEEDGGGDCEAGCGE